MKLVTRRIVGLGFITSLLSFVFPALAATKPTIPCRFVGQKTTYAGKVFTCQKIKVKGKVKLEWDSGKPLVTSSPSPSTSATSTPISSPTPASAPVTTISKITIPLGKSSEVPLHGSKIFYGKNRFGGTTGYIVVRNSTEIFAMSDVCTHSGCNVQIHKDGYQCPCHNALFDSKTGDVLRGPAAYPLNRIPTYESDGVIYVTD